MSGPNRASSALICAVVGAMSAGCQREPGPAPVHVDPPIGGPEGMGYLLISVAGKGAVRSTEQPPTIDCGDKCFGRYPTGTEIELTATAEEGWVFARFEGDDDCIEGKVRVDLMRRCVARFVPERRTLHSLHIDVKGEGTVVFSGLRNAPGCADACIRAFAETATVGLQPIAAYGWLFDDWEGDPDCDDGVVETNREKTCVAVFAIDPALLRRLRIDIVGHGRVDLPGASPSVPGCNRTCMRGQVHDAYVSLSPVADMDRRTTFLGWEGDPQCATGEVHLDRDRHCIARFGGGRHRLNLYVTPGGEMQMGRGGRCAPNPDLFDDTPCAFEAREGDVVELQPFPVAGYEFDRLDGDCASTSVFMDGDKSCRAVFRPTGPSCPSTDDAIPPAAPDDLRGVAHDCTTVSVNWAAATDTGCGVRDYELFRNGRRLARLPAQQTSFLDSSWARPQTAYTYEVFAIDGAGNRSPASRPRTVQTPTCPPMPSRIDTQIILVKFPEFGIEPVSPENAQRQLLAPSGSLNAYLEEVSYQQTTMTGEVHGWYVMPQSIEAYCNSWDQEMGGMGCDLFAIHSEVARLVDADIDFTNIERAILVINDVGDWGGVAGGSLDTDEGSIFPMITIAARHGFTLSTLAHEFGHTYNALHAGMWTCGNGNAGADHTEPLAGGCVVQTYGDPIDAMGGGMNHFSSFHKERLGWLQPSNIEVVGDDGEYTIEPLEVSGAGVKQLEIPVDPTAGETGDFYFLEFRRPVGFDMFDRSGRRIEGVIVRLALGYPTTNSADTLMPQFDWLIQPGVPYFDPSLGLLIEALSLGEESARVRITRGL